MLSTPCSAHVLNLLFIVSHPLFISYFHSFIVSHTHPLFLLSFIFRSFVHSFIHSSIHAFIHPFVPSFIQPSMQAFHSSTPSISHLSFNDLSTFSIIHASSFHFNVSFLRVTCVLNTDLQSTGLQTCWQAQKQQSFVCRPHVTVVARECCVRSHAIQLSLQLLLIHLLLSSFTYYLLVFMTVIVIVLT